ncbi:MAG TPA: hypothetical protein VNZ26_15625 [Vicinamibacterales bacterium]|jgi:hypothetical protein|nr:hypothetical protein [Vicinamibacterales bacterium]
MGTTFKTSLLVTAIFVGLSANSSSAQDVIDARIPFAFMVGSKEFSAGRYQFTTSEKVLTIRGRDNDAGMFTMTNPAGGRDPQGDDPVLVFNRYEKTYRLAEIWNSEDQGSSLVMRHHRKSPWSVASNKDRVLITPIGANDAK